MGDFFFHSGEEKTFHNESGETLDQVTQSSGISILGSTQNLTKYDS